LCAAGVGARERETVPFRTSHFYGMTTHSRGGLFLQPQARAIIDMGALHTRAVAMDERGKVLGYHMTSQCASGSGQFLENIVRYLGVSLEEVATLSLQADTPETCSSISAVLAETDVINMVSRGISLPNILKGIRLPGPPVPGAVCRGLFPVPWGPAPNARDLEGIVDRGDAAARRDLGGPAPRPSRPAGALPACRRYPCAAAGETIY